MTVKIPRSFVEYILLGPLNDRRQLQDSPLLGDVWTAFAAEPSRACDLLLMPVSASDAGKLAVMLDDRMLGEHVQDAEADADAPVNDPNIAYLDGVVAATLDFASLLKHVVPLTAWWHSKRNQSELQGLATKDWKRRLDDQVGLVVQYAKTWDPANPEQHLDRRLTALERYVALAGLILWAGGQQELGSASESLRDALARCEPSEISDALSDVLGGELRRAQQDLADGEIEEAGLVYQVAHNRAASPAIDRSVAAVKGDAARNLFSIDCSDIAWAVVDSGIDRTHPAFWDANGELRVAEAFDFSRFRRIVAVGNARKRIRENNLRELERDGLLQLPDNADQILEELGQRARLEEPTDWGRVEQIVRVRAAATPKSDHGTHVAGIIGACREGTMPEGHQPAPEAADGLCPDIKLYDFRILAPNVKDTEFAVIAVLQYIRHVNDSARRIKIHGANLSLSIPHEVRNYACGRTPVCKECERLIDSGVVVVAAAGNQGYQEFETADGGYAGYAAFSITDPGNADGVITVGATHRYSPHTYGVSFFSSRGPTGDGRLKPDIVAPGERISSPVLNQEWGDHDGTSMAAPHVSGAAAMLMARYPELVGQPRRIKQVLCENATDLGRERTFQGYGMLDILRALQSV